MEGSCFRSLGGWGMNGWKRGWWWNIGVGTSVCVCLLKVLGGRVYGLALKRESFVVVGEEEELKKEKEDQDCQRWRKG